MQYIIDLMKMMGLKSNEDGVCHGCAMVAAQAFILGPEQHADYVERLEKMEKISKQPNKDIQLSEMKKDIEIQAHLQTVEVFFQARKYHQLFDSASRIAQCDIESAAGVTESLLAAQQGGIRQVHTFSGVYFAGNYDNQEMIKYLRTWQETMEMSVHKKTRCALLLSSHNHVIMLGYDVGTEKAWIIDNHAGISRFSKDKLVDVANAIKRIFQASSADHEGLILGTHVLSTGDHVKTAKSACDLWHDKSRAIHQVTAEKAKLTGAGGSTWLYIAAKNGHAETVKELIQAGAAVNQAKGNGVTPLYIAVQNRHAETVKELIQAGADVNQAKGNGVTPLYIAAENGYTELLEKLIQAGADVNKAKANGVTPLYIAAKNGHAETVKELIQAGADVNKAREDGVTPLYTAAENGHAETVKELIQAGTDVNKAREDGVTPLYTAAENGHAETVKELIQAGADVNKARKDGSMPLYIAAQNGHAEVVKKLIQVDADVNKATKDGVTPLYIASEKGYTEVVKELIQAGADVNKANNNGFTPLAVARYMGHTAIVELLTEAQYKEKVVTPLYIATQTGHTERVEKHTQADTDVNKAKNATMGWLGFFAGCSSAVANDVKEASVFLAKRVVTTFV